MVVINTLRVKSSDQVPDIIDITKKIKRIVEKSGVKNGQVFVFTQHTTAAIILQEKEKGLIKDIKSHLKKLCPDDKSYYHSNSPDHIIDGNSNGHSHIQHLLLGGSCETVPISNGEMLLGTYQKIFLVELDRARTRSIIVQVIGE